MRKELGSSGADIAAQEALRPADAGSPLENERLPYGPFPLEIGRTYEIRFPFLREEYQPFPEFDDTAPGWSRRSPPTLTWVPGWDEGEDFYGPRHHCDGWGAELRTLVSLHRPAHYPERAFYVRQWRDPDGRVFGRKGLRIIASRDFRTWARGDRYAHTFDWMKRRNVGSFLSSEVPTSGPSEASAGNPATDEPKTSKSPQPPKAEGRG